MAHITKSPCVPQRTCVRARSLAHRTRCDHNTQNVCVYRFFSARFLESVFIHIFSYVAFAMCATRRMRASVFFCTVHSIISYVVCSVPDLRNEQHVYVIHTLHAELIPGPGDQAGRQSARQAAARCGMPACERASVASVVVARVCVFVYEHYVQKIY